MSEYAGYDIVQLWQMVDAARQSLQPTHDQVVALSKAQQMLSCHAESLQTARDQLAAKWPPESNVASAAYLTELDRLITAVRDTALSCAINVFHINTVSDAIVLAHATLKPLHREYTQNQIILAKYSGEITAFSEKASLTSNGKAMTKGAAKLLTSPAVNGDRQDQLNHQAQQTMISLSEAAQDGATYIRAPARYTPPTINGNPLTESPKEIGNSGSGSAADRTARPPYIDPPTNTQKPDDASERLQGTSNPAKKFLPEGTGPILSDHVLTPPSWPSQVPPAGYTPGKGSLVANGDSMDPIPRLIGGIGDSPAGIDNFGNKIRPYDPKTAESEKRADSRSYFGRGGVTRGGVIGNIPSGVEDARSIPPPSKPSGGVIGTQPAITTNRIAGAGISHSAAIGPHAGRGEREESGIDRRSWELDNLWVIDTGVEPVIFPAPLPGRFDPGPGVIGIDR